MTYEVDYIQHKSSVFHQHSLGIINIVHLWITYFQQKIFQTSWAIWSTSATPTFVYILWLISSTFILSGCHVDFTYYDYRYTFFKVVCEKFHAAENDATEKVNLFNQFIAEYTFFTIVRITHYLKEFLCANDICSEFIYY